MIHGGLVTVDRKSTIPTSQLWAPSWRGLTNQLKNWMPTLGKLKDTAQEKVERYGSDPFLFTLFYICTSGVMLISMPASLSSGLLNFVLYTIGITLCTGLLLRNSYGLKPYDPTSTSTGSSPYYTAYLLAPRCSFLATPTTQHPLLVL